jgi:hypothetical protein
MTLTKMALLVAVGTAAMLFVVATMRPWLRNCPRCKAYIPQVRIPTSFKQMLWGGWTCSNCGLELDRAGKPLVNQLDRLR